MVKAALLLNSGGLDTLVTAKELIDQGWELHSLYIYLGQLNNESAKISAKEIADKYCVAHEEIEVTGNPYLTEEHFIHVPFQAINTCLLGAMYARSRKIDYVATGNKHDAMGKEFYGLLTNLLSISKLNAPVMYLSPLADIIEIKQVVQKGLDCGLVLEEMKKTVSCNQKTPCWKCHKCISRIEAGI